MVPVTAAKRVLLLRICSDEETEDVDGGSESQSAQHSSKKGYISFALWVCCPEFKNGQEMVKPAVVQYSIVR